jgi:hypothetical protein
MDARVGAVLGEAMGEGMGVAGKIAGAEDTTGKGAALGFERWFKGGAGVGVEVLESEALIPQMGGGAQGSAHLSLAPVEVKDAPILGGEFDPGILADLGELSAIIEREAENGGGVGFTCSRQAIGEEAEKETPQRGVGAEMNGKPGPAPRSTRVTSWPSRKR